MFFSPSTGVRRVALAQAALAPLLALVGGMTAGVGFGVGLLYGTLAALAVTLVLVWREWQSMRHPEWDQHRLLRLFIRASLERLLLLIALLYAGLGLLELAPLPMLLGLLLAQAGWLAALTGRR
ncbi:MAG: ATP synthase subunit I [Gammaproteobacteria bacterium]